MHHYLSIFELSELIQRKQISPVEITESLLQRIQLLDQQLRSYITLIPERAMESAIAAEKEIMEGNYRGPLHGVPIAIKDLFYTKGVRTMGGLKFLKNFIPDFDATAVEKLHSAGAILLGKLNLSEGAFGGYHPDFEVPLNPWNPERWAGVSSSGSGVATAGGLCFGSLGSDTGGSIRYPSACCGVTGLKPTYGRVSRYGMFPLAESLDHAGPMTRTVLDAAIMFEAIAGYDFHDPMSIDEAVPNIMDSIKEGVKGLRIGFDETFATEDVHPEVVHSVKQAMNLLTSSGAVLVDIQVPKISDDIWFTICIAEALVAHSSYYPGKANEYNILGDRLAMGLKVTGKEYALAHIARMEFTGKLTQLFKKADILLMPTIPIPAMYAPPEKLYNTSDYQALFSNNFRRYAFPYNLSGNPTLSIPFEFSEDGIPLSIQFIGRHLEEALLCRVGHFMQQQTDWHERHPLE